MKRRSLDVILAFAFVAVVISGFAHTWKQVTTGGHSTVSMSADGRIICAIDSTSRPYISTNSGKSWAIATNTPPWGCYPGGVAISADGTKIIASLSTNTNGWQHWVFLSTDFGTTWTLMNLPSISGSATTYSVTCSADGEKLVAAAMGGPIYYSTNSGLYWNTSSTPNMSWSCLASSADGRRMVGAANGGIYFSTNFGANWTPDNPSPAGAEVCISSDGNWVGITGANTYISSDGGSHWMTNGFGPASIACSADGTDWIVGGPQVYISADGGKTWVTNLSALPPVLTYGVAASADFCQLIATGPGQGIWSGRAVPSPQLNIQSQDTNVAVSWLLPSTNFVLQQSVDLSNPSWTEVSANPTLNFTNLNQQVSVPATGSSMFFRLTAQ